MDDIRSRKSKCTDKRKRTEWRKAMKYHYNKLVRDRIPEIIEEDGKQCFCEILSGDAYLEKLDEKLNEELAEYQESKSIEELADLLEVMHAVVSARGYSWEDLISIREKKRAERGGFDKHIFLIDVIQ